ncbi:hypothetical protein OROGR_022360 [Orobanche gracilis]
MAALSNSLVISERPSLHFSTGSHVKSADRCLGSTSLAFGFKDTKKSFSQRRALAVQASYRKQSDSFMPDALPVTTVIRRRNEMKFQNHQHHSDDGRPSSTSVFVGGFLLGGLIAGTLGCVYAPQISNALISTDKKDLMKKLPKFIYDEEKTVECVTGISSRIQMLTFENDKTSPVVSPRSHKLRITSDSLNRLKNNFEKQRKKLAQRIEELNSAIDNVSNQFRSPPTEAGVSPDDIESVV